MKKQSGFTLIELVVVVVILGLLAVTAIPRFLDLTENAQDANIEGLAGGFATAVSLVRAQWEAEGRPSGANNLNTVNYDGINLILTTEDTAANNVIRPGYPTGLTDGNNLAGNFDVNNCIEVWSNILQQPPSITNNINTLNSQNNIDYFVSQSGTGNGALCHFYLRDTLNRDNNNNFTDPGTATNIGNSFTYQPATSAVVIHINRS